MFGDLGKMDRLAKLYFHINVTVCFLGINCCVFSESTDKGFQSSVRFQKGKEPKLERGAPWSWCCHMLLV